MTHLATAAAKCLQRYGIRVQFSVFECQLSEALLLDLLLWLRELIDQQEDNVRVYPLCATCAKDISVLGVPDLMGIKEAAFLI
jgi:CRISPR-associated protein Cas2